MTETHPDQGDGLEDDEVAGEKEALVRFDESDSEVVETVSAISESEKGRCVNED